MEQRRIDLLGAASIVVANMVGTGVFTSLGYQLVGGISTGFSIVAVWLIGGILAFMGALCYAEIATRLPQDGGEYYFLKKIYHPSVGFMAGFVSSTVGFAAPIASAALALSIYLQGVVGAEGFMNVKVVACAIILGISSIHAVNFKRGIQFQKVFTIIKVAIILVFIGYGFVQGNVQNVSFGITDTASQQILAPSFALGLVWVSFAYSGWNASAYVAGEIKDPERNLSRSILYGTAIVTIMYVLLNAVFFMSTPASSMEGKPDVGLIAGNFIFGEAGGKIMGGIVSVLLISTISSMIIAGPRVIKSMFGSIELLKPLSATNKTGNPVYAILFQTALSIIMVFTVKFDQLINYTAFTLSLFTTLTVMGTFILRVKYGAPKGYKAWGYPLTPLIFCIMSGGIAVYFMMDKPKESLWGLATVALGLGLYFVSDEFKNRHNNEKNKSRDFFNSKESLDS